MVSRSRVHIARVCVRHITHLTFPRASFGSTERATVDLEGVFKFSHRDQKLGGSKIPLAPVSDNNRRLLEGLIYPRIRLIHLEHLLCVFKSLFESTKCMVCGSPMIKQTDWIFMSESKRLGRPLLVEVI